ncbi:MAG: hypothetical protein PVH07_10930 [Chloroflexota bacterium]|jgi:hypothetical protein
MHRLTALAMALLLTLAAVPAAAQELPRIIPVLASSEIAQGPNRFLFSLTDPAGALLAAPDVAVRLEFFDSDSDPEAVVFEADARFLWAIEGVRGLYAADVEFPQAGRWGTRFYATFPDGTTETVRVDYDVWEETSTPPIGAPAPLIDTPTAEDVGGDVSLISSDPDPVDRFYQKSILDAIEDDIPAVIAFVTPSFCQTATCGPTIEKVKQVASSHPDDVNFVHVEPYLMHVKDGYLQPWLSEQGSLQSAPWTERYGLRTEPYVIVLDAAGLVRAKFEGAITVDELEDALWEALTPYEAAVSLR